jgi:hypothetical protein
MKTLNVGWLKALVLAIGLHCAAAMGQTAPKYAVVSLIGDNLNVAFYIKQTSTQFERNRSQVVPAGAGSAYDQAASKVVADKISNAGPNKSSVVLLAPNSPAYEDQKRLFDGSNFLVPAWLERALSAENATHLVLITKLRSQARISVTPGAKVGSGYIEGVGFYVDEFYKHVDRNTNQDAIGFLAPFAYVMVTLVDLKTKTVLDQNSQYQSIAFSTATNAQSLNPADALSSKEKNTELITLIQSTVSQAINSWNF